MLMPLLKQIGVEAVVEGLQEFRSDIGDINNLIESLKLPASGIEKAFDSITSAIGGFGREILNVVETALGVMLRDSIEWAIEKLGELAAAAFEAGNEFQLMKMRLRGFNLQDAINSGEEYSAAMRASIEMTKEQLAWVMRLAATTPFDATDIGNIFTLAKSYSFTTDQSKTLTESILDFTAAMGLSGVEAERIIINLGQMIQRGKITTREMNDLARGSFVPLGDILDRISQKLGITTAELTKMISQAGGVDPQLFIDAFNEMVDEEARFADGSVRMAHTFQGAWQNITQTIRDVIGGFIVMPGFLDPIGKVLGDIMDEVGARWDKITEAAQRVGDALGGVVQSLLDTFLPSAGDIADGIVGGLNNLADWVTEHKQDIIDFFAGIGTTIRDDVIPWFRDVLIPTIDKIITWVDTNGPTIKEFFSTLGEIVGEVFTRLTGGAFESKKGEGIEGFLDTLKGVMLFVIQNKEIITLFVTAIARLVIAFNIAVLVVNTALSALAALVGLIVSIFNPIKWMTLSLGEASTTILVLIGLWSDFKKALADVGIKISTFVENVRRWVEDMRKAFVEKINAVVGAFRGINWSQIGKDMIQGVINGIGSMAGALWRAAWNIGQTALNAIKAALGIASPSKHFINVGKNAMEGLHRGIKGGTDQAVKSMDSVIKGVSKKGRDIRDNLSKMGRDVNVSMERVARVASRTINPIINGSVNLPATAVPLGDRASGITNNNSTTTNNAPVVNNNLNITTNACREPIIADFRMLAGFS